MPGSAVSERCRLAALAVATQAITEFKVELDELHNDSTTVTFHGAYSNAAEEMPGLEKDPGHHLGAQQGPPA